MSRGFAIRRLIFLAKEEAAGLRGITADGTYFHVLEGTETYKLLQTAAEDKNPNETSALPTDDR